MKTRTGNAYQPSNSSRDTLRATQFMTTYRNGDVLLVVFPFVDEQRGKKPPALVICDTGDQDVVLARVTTQVRHDQFDLELIDWKAAGLLAPSVVRLHKLATIDKSLVQRQLGRVSDSDYKCIASLFRKLSSTW
ncbi:MAG TPA: type II toxin-antitoxin system PemK/MazF family toxin [Lacipirellulaceae bacterium]|nr:type II toxin-antitoxin system PemK/MazF family toxin [Lacipirellulaceae bacterium]